MAILSVASLGLTRALLGGGGGVWTPLPLRFFEDSENTATRFHPPYHHLFRNFCGNFDPRPCEVRSPGQVKWPNYKITFPSRHGYNVSVKVMKLSEYDEVISAYKTYISDFWYRWPQVRSFLRHYVNGQKINSVIFTLAQSFLRGIISYRTVVDNSSKKLHYLPLQRSFEVTRGHQPSFANNFW